MKNITVPNDCRTLHEVIKEKNFFVCESIATRRLVCISFVYGKRIRSLKHKGNGTSIVNLSLLETQSPSSPYPSTPQCLQVFRVRIPSFLLPPLCSLSRLGMYALGKAYRLSRRVFLSFYFKLNVKTVACASECQTCVSLRA